MDPAVLAQRNAKSLNRMVAAAQVLADRFGVPITLGEVRSRDPQLAALFQREAITELLEALVTATNVTVAGTLQAFQAGVDDLNVTQLQELIAGLDLESVNELEAAEQAGKNRKGVLAAVEERRAVLSATPQEGAA